MMVGVASGTYSSIFIASPVLTEWKEREPAYRSRRARIKEAMGFVPTFPEDNVVARIDEVERHDAAEPVGDGGGEAARAPEAEPARRRSRSRKTRTECAASADAAPVERATPPVAPTAEEAGDGVAGRPETGAERTKRPPKPQKKQSRRRRKHGRSR